MGLDGNGSRGEHSRYFVGEERRDGIRVITDTCSMRTGEWLVGIGCIRLHSSHKFVFIK